MTDVLSDRPMKIRYHLQNGIHKNHWQIKNIFNNSIIYLDPKNQVIRLTDSVLKNKRSTADKIYCGKTKTVCSWVQFRDSKQLKKDYRPKKQLVKINYNPKKTPYWNAQDDLKRRYDLDECWFSYLYLGALQGQLGVYACKDELLSKFNTLNFVCF